MITNRRDSRHSFALSIASINLPSSTSRFTRIQEAEQKMAIAEQPSLLVARSSWTTTRIGLPLKIAVRSHHY